ncbi:MAG: flagellar hook-basal body complex protein, partial [Candidatus Sumerlaeota bacterium]|nr:flagellar hook-basal body complex protein [Candidatus Sumerlaeota bacterium]
MRALFIAASGMHSQQINIDVIANNLANVNTSGFKKGRADFADLFYQTIRAAGTNASTNTEVPTGIHIGYGSRVASTQKIFTQGDFKPTNEELDMVIEGNGFFQITRPDGTTGFAKEDFPVGGVLRVWEFGVGDSVTLKAGVSLRRIESYPGQNVYEVMATSP